MKCSNCQKQIEYGQEAITTERCVLGPKGIIPLGELEYFCSEKCLKAFYSDDIDFSLPPRIP